MATIASYIVKDSTGDPREPHGGGSGHTEGGDGTPRPVVLLPPFQVAGLIPMHPCDAEDCRKYDIGRCCYKHKAFGYTQGGNVPGDSTYENDRSNFTVDVGVFGTNPAATCIFTIERCAGGRWEQITTIINNTYGTYEALGTIAGHPTYAMFYVNWGKVLQDFGPCSYRVVAVSALGELRYCLASEEVELREFHCFFADKTVKLETVLTGQHGSATNRGYVFDLCGLEFKDSIRIPGFFGHREIPEYMEVLNKYQNGKIIQVRDEAVETFKLFTRMVPEEIHYRISVYVMMADQAAVSDYNWSNPDYSIRRLRIRKNGGYKPERAAGVRESDVVIEFKAGIQNIIASLCCPTKR
jgi:hypothetical protein